jgi:mannan endo-1,4-beta-mannosidase
MNRATRAALTAVLTGLAAAAAAAPNPFVRVQGTDFVVDGKPYRYVGANFWYGLNLASRGSGGDRARLNRELDRLAALGVKNLRVMASSEGPDSEPDRMKPALQTSPGVYNPDVLDGLDYLIAQMSRRDMRAVMILNNMWWWSGGMAQYQNWFGGGPIPYAGAAHGWDEFQSYSARFYSNPRAIEAYRNHIRFLIERKNPYTGRLYRDEPAIMSWELANEPRGVDAVAAFQVWLRASAAFIKSLDPNHLVSTGCEGGQASPGNDSLDFARDSQDPNIDYATAHIWPQNFGWYDPLRAAETYPGALAKSTAALDDYAQKARRLGKPMVLEEFGLPRDAKAFGPAASTRMRDDYYGKIFLKLLQTRSPVAGVNFWAWSGEGRPPQPGGRWSPGDPWTGDPPFEPQGLYSVFDSDGSTLKVIGDFAQRFSGATAPQPGGSMSIAETESIGKFILALAAMSRTFKTPTGLPSEQERGRQALAALDWNHPETIMPDTFGPWAASAAPDFLTRVAAAHNDSDLLRLHPSLFGAYSAAARTVELDFSARLAPLAADTGTTGSSEKAAELENELKRYELYGDGIARLLIEARRIRQEILFKKAQSMANGL